jgi:hypothetical protein
VDQLGAAPAGICVRRSVARPGAGQVDDDEGSSAHRQARVDLLGFDGVCRDARRPRMQHRSPAREHAGQGDVLTATCRTRNHRPSRARPELSEFHSCDLGSRGPRVDHRYSLGTSDPVDGARCGVPLAAVRRCLSGHSGISTRVTPLTLTARQPHTRRLPLGSARAGPSRAAVAAAPHRHVLLQSQARALTPVAGCRICAPDDLPASGRGDEHADLPSPLGPGARHIRLRCRRRRGSRAVRPSTLPPLSAR